jgi:hypothetical protein
LVTLLGLCGLCGCGYLQYLAGTEDQVSNFYNYNGQLYVIGFGGTYGSSEKIFEYTPLGWIPNPTDINQSTIEANGQLVSPYGSSSGDGSNAMARSHGAAASSATPLLFISDGYTKSVLGLSASTLKQLQSITPAGRPYDLSLSLDQSTIYTVVNPLTSSQQPSIALIDTSSLAIRSTIALPAGTYPFWSAISPDGSTLYVSNNAAQYGTAPNTQSSYVVIDTASQKVTGNINVDTATSRPAVSPDGSLLLYIDGSAAMSAIDTATMTPSWTAGASGVFASAGFPPPHIVFSIGGQYAYALGTAFQVGGTYNAIFQVDTFQGKVVNTIPVGTSTSFFSDLAISGDGSMLLAADTSSGMVYVTHLPDNQPMGSFQGVSLTKISGMTLFIAQ